MSGSIIALAATARGGLQFGLATDAPGGTPTSDPKHSSGRLCDEAKPGQILISPRVLMKVENAVKVEPVGEFELKGIRRPLAAYNVLGAVELE